MPNSEKRRSLDGLGLAGLLKTPVSCTAGGDIKEEYAMKKKLLSIMLVLCMVLGMMPAVAAADGDDTASAKLPDAVDGVITLDKDMTVTADKLPTTNATLDLNGKTLTISDSNYVDVGNGQTLTVKNGKIVANATSGVVFAAEAKASIIFDAVEMETTGYALFPCGTATEVVVKNGSKITAGVMVLATNADNENGTLIWSNNVKLIVEDSTLISNNSTDHDNCAVLLNVPGTLEVNNSTISGNRQAVIVRGGTATIKNSNVKLENPISQETAGKYDASFWRSGNEVPGAALVVGTYQETSSTDYNYPAVCTVEGSTIIAPENYRAIYAYVMDNESKGNRSTTLSLYKSPVTGAVAGNVKPTYRYAIKATSEIPTVWADASNIQNAMAENAAEGDTVSFYVYGYTGSEVKSVSAVKNADNSEVELRPLTKSGCYEFSMPASSVTLNAEVEKINYNVVVNEATNGTVTADKTAHYGDTVTLTVKADDGYELDQLSVTKDNNLEEDKDVAVTDNGDGTYSFEMPWYNVNVTATFKKVNYTITVDTAEHGTVTVDKTTATIGDNVGIAYTAEKGYKLTSLKVMNGETEIKLDETNGFMMPAGNVTVTATFEAIKTEVKAEDAKPTTEVSEKIDEADSKKIEVVTAKAEVTGVAAAADTDKILAAAKDVDTTNAEKVEIAVSAKVEATEAKLTGDTQTLTFSVKPVAAITVDGVKQDKTVDVTNDMLSGKEITIKLPLPAGFEPKEIIHKHDDGTNEKVKFTIEDGVAIVKVTNFSSFVMNAKEHTHDWELIKTVEATDTTKGSKTYKCKVCGEEKTEDIDIVASKSLKLDETKVTLVMDGEKTLKLTIDPETATGTPVWKSSNEKVVTVDGGKLKAVGTGVATITVTLGDQKATCEVSVICSTKACEKYTDVDADEWYHPAVDYVTDNKIMQGIGTKLYGPKLDLTRAQLAQILYNLEAEPKNGETELTLTDVDAEEWYAAAVKWATSNKIVKGYPDKTFRPDDSVTRQDMVTMIARYAAYKKLTLVTDDSWKDFKDAEDVGSWAEDAMAWAVANGLVNGMTADTLVPNGTATRGQIAKIMMMFNSTYAVK